MADHDEGLMGAVGGGIDAGGVSNSATGSNSPMIVVKKNNILTKLFSSCSPDPRGSVHRAWGISLLFVVMYFALSIFEMVSLQQAGDGSVALIVAAIWTGIIHLALGVLGVLVVLANQNIILYASFHKYTQGSQRANQVFASLGFVLFVVLSFMSLLLVHFKEEVVVSPLDEDGIDDDDNNNNNENVVVQNNNNNAGVNVQQQMHIA